MNRSMRHGTSVTVGRPIESVWTFLTDPLNLPRWSGAWLGARPTSPGPVGLGTTFDGRRAILGVGISWSGVVTEWDPPNAFAYSVKVLGARSVTRLTLEATSNGTKVAKVGEREPRLVQKLMSLLLGRWLVPHHAAWDQKLERLLETGMR